MIVAENHRTISLAPRLSPEPGNKAKDDKNAECFWKPSEELSVNIPSKHCHSREKEQVTRFNITKRSSFAQLKFSICHWLIFDL